VFEGIGEFTIHKEFVSSKIAGDTASLTDPALDRILDFAGEVGLVALIHNDIDVPFPKPGQDPWDAKQLGELFRRHPKTHIIWAHSGVGPRGAAGRRPLALVERALADPTLAHVSIDISWDEVAKYIVATPETIARVAASINKFPDRFLFGSDEVAPATQASYLKVYNMYAPLLAQAHSGGPREAAQGQLRAPVRRGAGAGPGVERKNLK
jgi:predicted TIM-barrel fold metal-dependent hydrolase